MLKKADLKNFKEIYRKHIVKDFPREERSSLNNFKKRIINKNEELYIFSENGEEKAYTIIANLNNNFILISFLAVFEKYRGEGIGTKLLEEIKERFKDKKGIILEVESPEDAILEKDKIIRGKRIKFYEKSNYQTLKNTKIILGNISFNIMFLENKDNIFHKKQLDYLNYILSGGDIKEYRDTKYDTSQAHRFIVKKALEKLKNDKYVYIINNQLRIKQKDFLKTVEDIINAKNELEQFILIKSILCDDNTYVNSMFIDLIYGLDKRIIRDLVFCLTDTVDENWFKTDDFKTIIKVLIDEYNFQIKNQKLIYKYNVNQKISKEYKIKKYIEENCFFVEGQEFGLIAKSENDKGIPTLQQITDFINKVYNENFKKKEIRAFLITFGYDIDVYKRTSKNKVNCYKVFRSTQ